MSDKNHYPTLEKDRIPLSQKIVFGIGMLANQMFPAALGIFMVILVQGLGMDPLLWGLMAFSSHAYLTQLPIPLWASSQTTQHHAGARGVPTFL